MSSGSVRWCVVIRLIDKIKLTRYIATHKDHAVWRTRFDPRPALLVGYFLWREAENNGGALEPELVFRAIEAANRRNARTVIEAALSTASPKDLEFLHAMAEDNGPSAAGDIGQRLGARTNLVANYRTRLIAAGLIETAGYGKVGFAIPGLRQYLRANPPA